MAVKLLPTVKVSCGYKAYQFSAHHCSMILIHNFKF